MPFNNPNGGTYAPPTGGNTKSGNPWLDDANRRGGSYGGDSSGAAENGARQQIGYLGQSPTWQGASQAWRDQQQQWDYNQANSGLQQQKAFELAQGLANGSIKSAGYNQMAQGQNAAAAMQQGAALGAGGGARGASAAHGAMMDQSGTLQAQNLAALQAQQAGDQMSAQKAMMGIAQGQRAGDLGAMQNEMGYANANSQNALGFQGLQDEGSLWAQNAANGIDMAKMGLGSWQGQQNLNQQLTQQTLNQNYLSTGLNAAGSFGSTLGTGLGSGGGGGGGGDGSPYGLGNNPENPWWQG